MIIDGSKIEGDGEIRFKDNYEGERFKLPLSKENIDRFVLDKKTLPACAACLILMKSGFKHLIN